MKLSGLIIVSGLVIIALFAPLITPHPSIQMDLDRRLEGPNQTYLLGTDHLGRCLLSRLMEGTRYSLGMALLTQAMAWLIGITIGTIAGSRGGRLDFFLMRFVDLTLAFPSLILSLAIIGFLGPGIQNAMLAFALVHWAYYARLVRGLVLEIKERTFIEAARSIGVPPFRMLLRHYFPNLFSPLLVITSLDTGRVIFALSGLSFLGLGSQPPTPDWGVMLNEGRLFLTTAPHLMLFPGMAIFLTVMGFNLLGESLIEKRTNMSTFFNRKTFS